MCNYDIQLSSGALGEKKGGGLAIDVSSELVFLTKKEKHLYLGTNQGNRCEECGGHLVDGA